MNQDPNIDTVAAVPAAPAAKSATPARVLAALAVLLAVAAVGGTFYLWRQLNDQSQGAILLQRELQQIQARARERDTSLDRDLLALRTQQEAHQDALDILKAHQDDTHTQSSREWTLREAEYLLQIASQRLQLERDVGSAIVALAAADERLQELADPALLAVRRQLAIELVALRGVSQVDREGLALQLTGYAQGIDQLPLVNAIPSHAAAGAARPPATRDWRTAMDNAWQALQRLVVIRRDNRPLQPLLAPEQEYFLRQNLRLQLEAARLALLRDDALSFKSSVQTAEQWLQRYFDKNNKAVSTAIDALRAMAQQNIRPALPDINESLRLLRLQLAPKHVMEGRAPTVLPLVVAAAERGAWVLS